ncbi:MAG TPA: TIGR03435 family protein [Vicinamibacterales bacterium]|nr:TIGR03435 family protein [Vicinamibacterales bacterium]
MNARLFAVLAVIFGTALAAAQGPAFEVVSVKPQPQRPVRGARAAPNRYYQPDTVLRSVIEFAYDLPSFRLENGPGWIESDRWAIDARAAVPARTSEMRLMVRRLLADRFKFTAHVETRELPIYELYLAREDGKIGPNARPAALDCAPYLDGVRSVQELKDTAAKDCSGSGIVMAGIGASGVVAVSHTTLRGVPMSALTTHLERALRRGVRDKTGVSGPLDLELTYATDNPWPERPSLAFLAQLKESPPLFTALREQLGLELRASRGPVDVLVIDSVERPTPD